VSLNDKETLPMRNYTEQKETQIVDMETPPKYNLNFYDQYFLCKKRILAK
jgi:hypothetical protein